MGRGRNKAKWKGSNGKKRINRGSDSKVEGKEGKLVNVIGKRIPSIRK